MKRLFPPILLGALLLLIFFNANAQRPVITSPNIRYDISKAVYAGNTEGLDVSNEETDPLTVQFNDDGSKLFVLGSQESTITQYDLSEAYDISTGIYAGLAKEFYVGNESSDPRGFVFNDDGMRFFIVGGADQFVYEYHLSAAYEVSTATYAGSSEGLDISTEVTNPYDLAFNDAGDIMVFLDFDADAIVEYSLSSAYDVSTASHSGTSEEFSISSEESEPLGFAFSKLGDQLFLSGRDRSIVSYSLSAAFDISTATYAGASEELEIGEGEIYPEDLVFDESGLQLSVVAGANVAVFSYNLTYTMGVDENSTSEIVDIEANDGQGGVNDISITYSLQGADARAFDISDTGILTFISSPDFELPVDSDSDNIYEIVAVASGLTSSTDFYIQIDVQNVPDTPIIHNDYFDVSTATYSGSLEDLIVSNEDGNPLGLSFNADGSKLFVLGNQGDAIVSYSLAAPYDVSTASYDGASAEFSVSNEETNPLGFTFNSDGTQLYVLGATDQSIVSYSLSTAFDLSTASHDGIVEELYIGGEEATALDLTFNGDGTQLFIVGDTDDAIVTYDLAVSYDVSTATYSGGDKELLIDGEDNPYGISFNDNGKRLFVVGGSGDRIMEYFITDPYDLSTAIYHGDAESLDLSDEESEPVDLTFQGATLYVLGSSGGKVYEYELGADVSFIENDENEIIDIEANDGMGGIIDDGVTYSLTGADASLFAIDATGNLTFIEIPDFETPLDEGSDNEYDLNIVADNDINKSELPFKVRVDDLADVPVFETEFEGSYDVVSGIHTGADQELDLSDYLFWVPSDFEFSSDGMKVFTLMSRRTFDYIFEFDLSMPYDLSTAEFAVNSERLYITNVEATPQSLKFNDDGSKLFIVGTTRKSVIQYSLSTPYDVSTSVYAGQSKELYVGDEVESPGAMEFSEDGTRLFLMSNSFIDDYVHSYLMSVPYAVNTAIYESKFEIHHSIQSDPVGLTFDQSGKRMIIVDRGSDRISEFVLDEPYVISSANYSGEQRELDLSGQDGQPERIKFDQTGSKLFVLGISSYDIIEYELPGKYSITENSNYSIEVDANDGMGGSVDSNINYTLEGDDAAQFSISPTGELSFLSSPDYETPMDEGADNLYEVTVKASNVYNHILQRINFEVMDDDDIPVILNEVPELFSVSNILDFDSQAKTFSLGGRASSLVFSPDGKKLFTLDSDNWVREYELSEGFNVITSSLVNSRGLYLGNHGFQTDISFSEDGLMLFSSGPSAKVLYKYNLEIPFDLSTSSFAGDSESLNLGLELSGFYFADHGGFLFTVAGSKLRRYELASPYQSEGPISELEVDLDFTVHSIFLDISGKHIFLVNRFDQVVTYELLRPFDITHMRIIEENQFFLDINDIAFDPVGSKLYAVTNRFVSIFEYRSGFDPFQYLENSEVNVFDVNATAGFSRGIDENIVYSLHKGDTGLFSIDDIGIITFNESPDFEKPSDGNLDNQYVISVEVNNGFHSVFETLVYQIIDVDDEDPAFTSATAVSISENFTDLSYTITTNETATYTLGTTKDESPFTIINGNEIHFTSAPDYESPLDVDKDNSYLVDIIAEDNAGNQSIMELTVTVMDLDEIAPTITSDQSIAVNENAAGTFYTATANETVTFSLSQGADEEYFLLTEDGALSFTDIPDFEMPFGEDNTYELEIIATDGAGNSVTMALTVEVTDVDEIAPTITSASSVEFSENASGVAYMAEADEAVTFTLGTTKDESLFEIEKASVSFILAPNFENPFDADQDNAYVMDLIASDAAGNVTTLEVTISVTDKDEIAPVFESSNKVEFSENTEGPVYNVLLDEEATLSLGTFKDEFLFDLNDKELRFIESPDFENPVDSDKDNLYVLDLIAVDDAGNSSALELEVAVIDLDDNDFSITSPNQVTFEENSTGIAYAITSNTEVTYALGSSLDENRFVLNGEELSFLSPPNFETPNDLDADNNYEVELIATNLLGQTRSKVVTIIVTDVDEPQISGDLNGDGTIGDGEIAGDRNGDGIIGEGEIAGDVNGDGIIGSGEIAGDINGDGIINGGDGTRIEGTTEIAGDVSGDGIINAGEISGDVNGDKAITDDEIAGDSNGDQEISENELAGDVDANGSISDSEILGDTDGNGEINDFEIAGDSNGDGMISSEEQVVLASNKQGSFIIFPIPASNVLFLQWPSYLEIQSITITDLSGRRLKKFKKARPEINIESLKPGAYLILFENSQDSFSRVFIKGN